MIKHLNSSIYPHGVLTMFCKYIMKRVHPVIRAHNEYTEDKVFI